MGVGMILVLAAEAADGIAQELHSAGQSVFTMGTVTTEEGIHWLD
jgi:phosphoribosylaminoimidazole (AIR) synthetase